MGGGGDSKITSNGDCENGGKWVILQSDVEWCVYCNHLRISKVK